MKTYQSDALAVLETYPDSEYKTSLKTMINFVVERKL
jgi:octaprenyl-diphosphate synthase